MLEGATPVDKKGLNFNMGLASFQALGLCSMTLAKKHRLAAFLSTSQQLLVASQDPEQS